MENYEHNRIGSAFSRTVGKVMRRLAGLALLAVAIGLSTCQALDGVRESDVVTSDLGQRQVAASTQAELG